MDENFGVPRCRSRPVRKEQWLPQGFLLRPSLASIILLKFTNLMQDVKRMNAVQRGESPVKKIFIFPLDTFYWRYIMYTN